MSKKIPEFAIYNFKGSWQVEKTWYLKSPIVDISRFDYGETTNQDTKQFQGNNLRMQGHAFWR